MASAKYIKIQNAVKIFKNLSDELGEPNKLLLFAKVDNPTLSLGIRIKIIIINRILIMNPIAFNILVS